MRSWRGKARSRVASSSRGRRGSRAPVTVQTGITDGNFTEIVSGDLKEGQEVLLGVADPKGAGRPNSGPRLRL